MRRANLNPVAWLLWFIASCAIPLTSRNPLYLALTLMVVIAVHVALRPQAGASNPWRLFAYIGSTVALLSIGFNVLTVHSGDRQFASLPESWPIVGGQLTYNGLLYGVASALAISSVLFAAATFNSSVQHVELIRRIPASFQQFGIATAIALNFVPQTIQAGREIYDAQRARGLQMRGVGDARAFLVPLLGIGLERALQTSEALETRGYGSRRYTEANPNHRKPRAIAGLALVVAALPLLAMGRIALALAAILIAILVVFVRRQPQRERLYLTSWDRRSYIVAACALLLVFLVGIELTTGASLGYSPFPRLEWPPFEPFVGLVIALQLAPAFLAPGTAR